jgi:hypothetical protein
MQSVQNNKEPIHLCSLYFVLVTHIIHVALLDMRLEVLLIWSMTLCNTADRYQRFGSIFIRGPILFQLGSLRA